MLKPAVRASALNKLAPILMSSSRKFSSVQRLYDLLNRARLPLIAQDLLEVPQFAIVLCRDRFVCDDLPRARTYDHIHNTLTERYGFVWSL